MTGITKYLKSLNLMNKHTTVNKTHQYKDEDKGKDIYRHAYAYAEKLETKSRLLRTLSDLFSPDLCALRNKLQEKCEQILYLSCSKRLKAEQLLWRHVMYSAIGYCKQHKEIIDSSHPYHGLYQSHLINSGMYYQQLLQTLQEHYGIWITKMTPSQLEDLDHGLDCDSLWLKESCHRCFIYLGDLARYQVELGFNPQHAIAYYEQAIELDPANGLTYNQMGALYESLHQPFNAIFYYLRSMTAPKPFTGVERNIDRLFTKTSSLLTQLQLKQETIKEEELPHFKKEMFLTQFIELQHLFIASLNKGPRETTPTDLSITCSRVSRLLEECLENDMKIFYENAPSTIPTTATTTATTTTSKEQLDINKVVSSSLLNCDIMLKLSALSILPAYNLRLKGSSDTLTACAFGLTVFSQLLLTTYNRLLHSILQVIRETEREKCMDDKKFYGLSMVEILMRENTTQNNKEKLKTATTTMTTCTSKEKTSKEKKTFKQHTTTTRRRRRRRMRGNGSHIHNDSSNSSSEDENNTLHHTDSNSSGDDSSLSSMNEREIKELHMIDSLSSNDDSSCTDNEDDKPHPLTPPTTNASINEDPVLPTLSLPSPKSSPKQATPPQSGRPKRQFILAANFTMAAKDHTLNQEREEKVQSKKNNDEELVADIKQLQIDTYLQCLVHEVCTLVDKEEYMKCLKIIIDWLLSYPAVLATYGKSSLSSLWSRLADLLNLLPNEKELHSAGLLETHSCTDWTQTHSIIEYKLLKGFGPLLRLQQSLHSSTNTLSSIEQTIIRIKTLIKFGHQVVSAQTVKSFRYDNDRAKFIGPAQLEKQEEQLRAEKEQQVLEEAKENRSKLMKLMAHKRLQSEVAALSEASGKTKEGVLFTPYIVPDAWTLCHSLHLIKKLMQSKSFIIIIAKSVIESLDLMKKERSNFPARDAIKFLEKQLEEGNKFIKTQTSSQTLHSTGRKKPHGQDIQLWLFDGLIDCAIHFNTNSPSTITTTTNGSLVTMLIDKSLLDIFHGKKTHHHTSAATPSSASSTTSSSISNDDEKIQLLTTARQHGVEIDTVLKFYRRWQREARGKK